MNQHKHKLSKPLANRQKDIDNENTVLLTKIMQIMKRKNKSLSDARASAIAANIIQNKSVLGHDTS